MKNTRKAFWDGVGCNRGRGGRIASWEGGRLMVDPQSHNILIYWGHGTKKVKDQCAGTSLVISIMWEEST